MQKKALCSFLHRDEKFPWYHPDFRFTGRSLCL